SPYRCRACKEAEEVANESIAEHLERFARGITARGCDRIARCLRCSEATPVPFLRPEDRLSALVDRVSHRLLVKREVGDAVAFSIDARTPATEAGEIDVLLTREQLRDLVTVPSGRDPFLLPEDIPVAESTSARGGVRICRACRAPSARAREYDEAWRWLGRH